jgi:hypothetical protein
MPKKQGIGYKDAGVNIDEADRAVASIRKLAKKTFNRSVLTDIGSFGGGYLLKGWKNPVLVSSADGVGTKIKLAFATGATIRSARTWSTTASTTSLSKGPFRCSSWITSRWES